MNPQIQIFLTQKCVFLSCIDSEGGKKATDCIRLPLLGMFPGFDTDVSKSYFQAEQYND